MGGRRDLQVLSLFFLFLELDFLYLSLNLYLDSDLDLDWTQLDLDLPFSWYRGSDLVGIPGLCRYENREEGRYLNIPTYRDHYWYQQHLQVETACAATNHSFNPSLLYLSNTELRLIQEEKEEYTSERNRLDELAFTDPRPDISTVWKGTIATRRKEQILIWTARKSHLPT